MIAGHGVAAHGPLDGVAPHAKLVAVAVFVVAVVSLPRERVWAFAALAVVLAAATGAARVPPGAIVRRWLLAAPFLALVPVVALVAEGERSGWGPVSVSRPGSWAAWGIGAKALLGLSATALVVATTSAPALVAGLERLRVPPVFTATAGFMLRYLDLTVADARRLRDARLARGDDPRWAWQARGVAAGAGTLFVRTYERGERVHRAMLARGYAGRMPVGGAPPAGWRDWLVVAPLPAAGLVVAAMARLPA